LPAGEQGFADTASRSRSQPKMEDNLFTSTKHTGKTHCLSLKEKGKRHV